MAQNCMAWLLKQKLHVLKDDIIKNLLTLLFVKQEIFICSHIELYFIIVSDYNHLTLGDNRQLIKLLH